MWIAKTVTNIVINLVQLHKSINVCLLYVYRQRDRFSQYTTFRHVHLFRIGFHIFEALLLQSVESAAPGAVVM